MNWFEFWQDYRPISSFENSDFLYQVGKSINGMPIDEKTFLVIIRDISAKLKLSKNDLLLDLCCGNGVITNMISKEVKEVFAIDFSKSFIENAIRYNSASNISYLNHNILDLNNVHVGKKFNKVLIYDAIASFEPSEISELLEKLKEILLPNAILLIGSILDSSRKYHFYNTLGRKWFYFYNIVLLKKNNGIGRWWKQKELNKIAVQKGYQCSNLDQDSEIHTAHYRFDCLLNYNKSN